MWEDIITGGVVLALVGVMLRTIWNKLGYKVDKDMCETHHNNITKELDRGHEKFEKIDKTITDFQTIVHNLDTNTQLLRQSIDKMNGKGG